MVMFQPYIPAIILAAIYIIWLIKRPRPLRALPRLLFLSGCLLLFCYYFVPLPFDAAGFRAVSLFLCRRVHAVYRLLFFSPYSPFLRRSAFGLFRKLRL